MGIRQISENRGSLLRIMPLKIRERSTQVTASIMIKPAVYKNSYPDHRRSPGKTKSPRAANFPILEAEAFEGAIKKVYITIGGRSILSFTA